MARAKRPTGKQARLKTQLSSIRKKVEKGLLKKMGPAITKAVQALQTKPQVKVTYPVTYAVTSGV